jgi:beta-phosphoglucomutase-like phosphatase (HAD superfamily)
MIGAGLPVPPGFTVTTHAFRESRDGSGVVEALRAALDGLDPDDPDDVSRRATTARAAVLSGPIPADIEAEIRACYGELTRRVDVVVDGSAEGVLKPDPRIYRLIAARLGASCEEIVFLDDQPVNLAGAEAVGMTAVPVDVTDPEAAFARARELLGLPPSDA